MQRRHPNTQLTNRIISPFLKVPVLGFVGTARIKRTDFGLTQYMAVIGDEVDLKIALELLQAPARLSSVCPPWIWL